MPAKTTKKDAPKTDDDAPARAPKTDRQGHPEGGIDFVPDADQYDPEVHANHSHLNP